MVLSKHLRAGVALGPRHLSLGLLIAAFFTATLPGAALGVPSTLELTERVLIPHWTILKLDVHSGVVEVEATILDPPSPNSITFAFFDAVGRRIRGIETYVWRGPDDHFLVATDAGPGFRFHFGEEGASPDPPFSAQTSLTGWTGVAHVLVMGAGRAANLELTVRADDAAFLARSEGTRAHFIETIDFDGPLNVHAQAFGHGVRTVIDGAVTVVAEHSLLAMYYRIPLVLGAPAVPVERMSVRTPSGEEHECPCYWGDVGGASARGPGNYEFRLNGSGAMVKGLGRVGLVVGDISLPA